MWTDWFRAPAREFPLVALTFVCVYVSIIFLTRLTGLRSFSKMSASDFAMTVAVGSLFASSVATSSPPLSLAIFSLACLFAGQWAFAFARRKRWVRQLIDNTPVLLMEGSTVLEHNMARTNVTHADLRSKLRQANVLDLGQVRAVVFETTGDMSVLHTSDASQELAEELLEGVRR